ncbi:MAG TPA: pyruvate kinase [Alphaproteobacteria bacterium]|nr:pyruvate kinase [Alphaproteobacteria bacterium]
MIRRYRQTKIVATLGPASGDPVMMKALFEAGVDMFRLNFSHGSHDAHRKNVETARALEAEFGRPIALLADMQGPKLRIGRFKNDSIEIHQGMAFRFDLDDALGDETRVQLPHPEVIEAMEIGSEILLDDGKVRVKITAKDKNGLDSEIVTGSKLSNNKGFNIPGIILPIAALTEKDRLDLEAAIGMGVDWIAQSFVQKPEDVIEAQKLIKGRAALMAKIEKPSAVKCIDEIIDVVDGIMLARGDLGVEIPPEQVPAVQKKVVRRVRHAGKPVIVATQMLESMIDNARPTRAEASDVATAVYDGADAVMLSAETAVGQYPVEAVSIMNRICESTESDNNYRRIMDADHPETEADPSDAITVAATYVAEDIGAAAIVNYTTSGSTTLRTVRQRPDVPVLCLTQNIQTARRLVLSFGVRTIHITDVSSFAETVERAVGLVKEKGYAQKGGKIVLTAGVPFGVSGTTNVLRIADVV